MDRREGGFKDIDWIAHNAALFVDLLWNIFSLLAMQIFVQNVPHNLFSISLWILQKFYFEKLKYLQYEFNTHIQITHYTNSHISQYTYITKNW